MAISRRKNRPVRRARVALAVPSVASERGKSKDGSIDRAIDAVAQATQAGTSDYLSQAGAPADVNIRIGINVLSHGLGRPVIGVIAIPVASSGPLPGFDPTQPGNATPFRVVHLTSLVDARYRLVFF